MVSIYLAWVAQKSNVALFMAAGIGGMLAAISGPLFVGIFWKGTTRLGAIAGLFMGGISFLFFKLAVIEMIFGVGEGGIIVLWLVAQAVNPFACIALGIILSITTVFLVSNFTEPPSERHLGNFFK